MDSRVCGFGRSSDPRAPAMPHYNLVQLGGLSAFFFLFTTAVRAFTVISKSDLVKCDKVQGTDPNSDLNCKNKLVILLTITNNQQSRTGSLNFFQWDVKTPNGTELQLKYGYRIGLTKSETYVVYPLTYVQTFSAAPYEIDVLTEMNSCRDDPQFASPTCGWAYNGPNRIPDSQGFCCKCESTKNMKKQGTNSYTLRAGTGMECWNHKSHKAAATCLRWGGQWYPSYAMQAPSMSFAISIHIDMATRPGDPPILAHGTLTPGNEVLTLSPSNRAQLSASAKVLATLSGDFVNYKSFPQLNDQYLSIPIPSDFNDEFAQRRWLALSQSLYTLDGLACNKIGVSYAAFRDQPERCTALPGSCLKSQLIDYVKVEDGLLAQNPPQTRNSITREGAVRFWERNNDKTKPNLMIRVDQEMVSVIVLEVDASGVEFIQNRSPGKIISAQALPFEAASRQGFMEVVVQNTGSVIAEYAVRVANCSLGIQDPHEQRLSIQPAAKATLKFELVTGDTEATTRSCNVTLLDSGANVADQIATTFLTTQTSFNNGTQGGTMPDPNSLKNYTSSGGWSFPKLNFFGKTWGFLGNIGNNLKGFFGSCDQCSSTDAKCLILKFCWKQIAYYIGIILAIVAVIFAIGFLNKLGMLGIVKRILKIIFCYPIKFSLWIFKKIISFLSRFTCCKSGFKVVKKIRGKLPISKVFFGITKLGTKALGTTKNIFFNKHTTQLLAKSTTTINKDTTSLFDKSKNLFKKKKSWFLKKKVERAEAKNVKNALIENSKKLTNQSDDRVQITKNTKDDGTPIENVNNKNNMKFKMKDDSPMKLDKCDEDVTSSKEGHNLSKGQEENEDNITQGHLKNDAFNKDIKNQNLVASETYNMPAIAPQSPIQMQSENLISNNIIQNQILGTASTASQSPNDVQSQNQLLSNMIQNQTLRTASQANSLPTTASQSPNDVQSTNILLNKILQNQNLQNAAQTYSLPTSALQTRSDVQNQNLLLTNLMWNQNSGNAAQVYGTQTAALQSPNDAQSQNIILNASLYSGLQNQLTMPPNSFTPYNQMYPNVGNTNLDVQNQIQQTMYLNDQFPTSDYLYSMPMMNNLMYTNASPQYNQDAYNYPINNEYNAATWQQPQAFAPNDPTIYTTSIESELAPTTNNLYSYQTTGYIPSQFYPTYDTTLYSTTTPTVAQTIPPIYNHQTNNNATLPFAGGLLQLNQPYG